MSTDVGQTLDKYELLERVGQGGMAVVYRGFDRSLEREVAVKVLHHHLAESGEARDRFEREARAVAKLHHENILEIYDFSGVSSPESYIVTEFIDGSTLKDFICEHAIRYPEVGAMVAVQVCRALSHAHSLGILHRDVKPENIMIRSDGVVKLTDFGIAQMVDLQRMTLTGQLLGSPAYMSPEHVEGKRLDFRTDVFSTGILLYQLVTGVLPFTGRNPHEVLKRIADCRYRDPRLLNPLVGDSLARIVDRALAREPDDRYPDVSLMLGDLDRYLDESGLSNYPEELARFFAAPVAYEMALRPRLIDELTRRGRELLDYDRVAALEAFNRVLTIEPENVDVLAVIERLSRRRRGARAAAIFAAIAALGAIGLAARPMLAPTASDAADAGAAAISPPDGMDAGGAAPPVVGRRVMGPPAPSGLRDAAPAPPDAEPESAGGRPDGSETRPENRPDDRATDRGDQRPSGLADAAPAGTEPRTFTLTLYPPSSEYRVGDGPWQRAAGGRATIQVAEEGPITVTGRNDECCEQASRVIEPGASGGDIDLSLGYLPGHVVPRCDASGVRVQIDGRSTRLGRPAPIFFEGTTLGAKPVEVVFFKEDASSLDRQTVRVKYNERREVRCEL